MSDTPGQGHNSGEVEVLNQTAQGQLKAIVERYERLLEDRAAVNNDLKELRAEAKGNGFDTKILAKAVKIKANLPKHKEEEALTDLYLSALDLL